MSIPATVLINKSSIVYYIRINEAGELDFQNEYFEKQFRNICPASIWDIVKDLKESDEIKACMAMLKRQRVGQSILYFKIPIRNKTFRHSIWEISEAGGIYSLQGYDLYDINSKVSHQYARVIDLFIKVLHFFNHGARLPLANILGLAKALSKEKGLSKEVKEIVGYILQSTISLDDLLREAVKFLDEIRLIDEKMNDGNDL